MTLYVNMVGGPGTGKSTTAAGVFYELKRAGVNCELVPEYAKDLVWGENLKQLGNQVYILGKQYNRLWRLEGKVDVVVTDCPLLLSMYYGDHMSQTFKKLVLELFNSMDNETWFLERVKEYNPSGRYQTEAEAIEIDKELLNLLEYNDVPFKTCPAAPTALSIIVDSILSKLDMVG